VSIRLIFHAQLSGRSLRSDRRQGRHTRQRVLYDSHDGNVYDTVNKFDYGAANDHGARVTPRGCAETNQTRSTYGSPRTTIIRVRRTSCTSHPTRIPIHRTVQDWFISRPLSGHIGSAAVQLDHQMEANVALTVV